MHVFSTKLHWYTINSTFFHSLCVKVICVSFWILLKISRIMKKFQKVSGTFCEKSNRNFLIVFENNSAVHWLPAQ